MLQDPSDIDKLFGIDRIVFYKNGLVVYRKPRFPMMRKPPITRKGVFEMSKKSRLRLTHIVANCEVTFRSMMTLTYGDFFIPYNGKILKQHINLFLTNFRRKYDADYIWFLEFTKTQKRAHVHIITSVSPNNWDKQWLGLTWAKITVLDYAKKIIAGKIDGIPPLKEPIEDWVIQEEAKKVFNVHSHKRCWEVVRKKDGAMRYCLKYALKEEQKLVPPSFQNVGRFWGTSRQIVAKPLGELLVGETMSEEQVKAVFEDTRIGNYPLIPKYVFERDALQYYVEKGMKLTEFFTQNE